MARVEEQLEGKVGELLQYDSVSVEPIIWVQGMGESESGQMVLEKIKRTYFDAYLWQTMARAKEQLEGKVGGTFTISNHVEMIQDGYIHAIISIMR